MISIKGFNPEEATNLPDGKPDIAIIPYIITLNENGYETLQSCSGHREPDSITDGILWIKVTKEQEENIDWEALNTPNIMRAGLLKIPEECLEIVFLGVAHDQLENSMEVIFRAIGINSKPSFCSEMRY